MSMYVFEVLEMVKKAKTKAVKIEILRKNESWALKDVLKGTLDPNVKWLFPKGKVPYTPCQEHNAPTNLLREHKNFKYFVEGSPASRNLSTLKRETMFIGILEGIHPKDSEYLVDMINKKPFGSGLTPKLVNEAFPGLIST